MSLLMQALKKAEQSKQKQNDVAAIEESAVSAELLPPAETKKMSLSSLSLDVDDAHMHTSQNATQIIEPSPAVVATTSFMELSLTPHQNDGVESKANESLDASPVEISDHDVDKADSAFNKVEPSLDAVSAENAVPAEITSNIDAKNTRDQSEPIKEQITHPKIDVEQKKLVEQANQARLLDQQKARAVFSSKAPTNNLRLKWLSIVAIAVMVALIGFAYMVWQKSNASSNQFPVAPQLAEADVGQVPQEVLASSAGAEKLPDQAASDSANIEQVPAQKNGEASTLLAANSTVKNAQEKVTKSLANPPTTSMTKPITKSQAQSPTVAKNTLGIQENLTANGDTPKLSNKASSKANLKAMGDTNGIQIRKGSIGAKINPNLVSAYQAYIAGDRVLASAEYQKVLQQEPNNRDALLGMAAIALNQRQAEQAGEYYAKLLVLDPNDADAIAGLTSLQQADPVQSESRLKAALNQNPSSGSILFALGNLYAQQSRWSDAQQTYFRAYANTPVNADYAFNLAISLDRLNQRKLAMEYYQRALILAKSGPGNFNANKVQQRLTQLENIRDN